MKKYFIALFVFLFVFTSHAVVLSSPVFAASDRIYLKAKNTAYPGKVFYITVQGNHSYAVSCVGYISTDAKRYSLARQDLYPGRSIKWNFVPGPSDYGIAELAVTCGGEDDVAIRVFSIGYKSSAIASQNKALALIQNAYSEYPSTDQFDASFIGYLENKGFNASSAPTAIVSDVKISCYLADNLNDFTRSDKYFVYSMSRELYWTTTESQLALIVGVIFYCPHNEQMMKNFYGITDTSGGGQYET